MTRPRTRNRRPSNATILPVPATKTASRAIESTLTTDGKSRAAVELGRRGGIARSKSLTKSARVRIAQHAAATRWKTARKRAGAAQVPTPGSATLSSGEEPARVSTSPHAIRATSEGEVVAHAVTRAEFLRHVLADRRTRKLFAMWGETTGVGDVVDQMIDVLNAVARQAGLAHRSALRQREWAYHLAPVLELLQLQEDVYERLLAKTHEVRSKEAIGFVVAELYGMVVDEDVPIRGWLASDLLSIFRWEVAARVYGEIAQLKINRPPTVDLVPKGQRPKGAAEHLKRNAQWYSAPESAFRTRRSPHWHRSIGPQSERKRTRYFLHRRTGGISESGRTPSWCAWESPRPNASSISPFLLKHGTRTFGSRGFAARMRGSSLPRLGSVGVQFRIPSSLGRL